MPPNPHHGQPIVWCVEFLREFKLFICFQGGIYLFSLMESYSAGFSILIIGFVEAIVIGYLYGEICNFILFHPFHFYVLLIKWLEPLIDKLGDRQHRAR